MIINDNGRLYESEEMLAIAVKSKGELTSYERDVHREFSRLVYSRYVQIRSNTSDNQCHKLSPEEVEKRINMEDICRTYGYSKKESLFYINYARKFIRIIQ